MYLLHTDTFKLIHVEKDLRYTPQYAILSHRWGKEIEFPDLDSSALHDDSLSSIDPAFHESASKIKGACAVAQSQGLEYIWIDNLCIDKSSSEELRKSLNSMFAWYREATICYTNLPDVRHTQIGPSMFDSNLPYRREKHQPSEWFERGWTLQELLAPRAMQFYDASWTLMGTRHDLAETLSLISGINSSYLKDEGSERMAFREASVSTKMSWMAGRTTRDVEDIAYSLLGVFNVNLTPRYGEGITAFLRLQESIMAQFGAFDESLFAWQTPEDAKLSCYRKFVQSQAGSREVTQLSPRFNEDKWGLLAPSPDCFKSSGGQPRNITVLQEKLTPRLGAGFQQSHQGISFSLNIRDTKQMLTGRDRKDITLPLNCWMPLAGGSRLANVIIQLERGSNQVWARTQCKSLKADKDARVRNKRMMDQMVLTSMIAVHQPQFQLDWVQ